MTRRITQAPREKGAFERHAQSIIAALVLAVVLYTGTTMQEIKEQSAKTAIEVAIFQKSVSDKISSLDGQMAQLQVTVNKVGEDRFRGSDAATAFAVRDTKMADLEIRMRSLEKELAAHAAYVATNPEKRK